MDMYGLNEPDQGCTRQRVEGTCIVASMPEAAARQEEKVPEACSLRESGTKLTIRLHRQLDS